MHTCSGVEDGTGHTAALPEAKATRRNSSLAECFDDEYCAAYAYLTFLS
jgi:hypothetical protein